METDGVPSAPSSNSDDESPDRTPAPDSFRHTSHTGGQGGLGGLGYWALVAWHHFRPFIPFLLISFMVVALVYLIQAIVFGGPYKDPHFFAKFNERWPRPAAGLRNSPAASEFFRALPSPSFELHADNETM